MIYFLKIGNKIFTSIYDMEQYLLANAEKIKGKNIFLIRKQQKDNRVIGKVKVKNYLKYLRDAKGC